MANTLMEKAGERMFVPPEKVQAFLDDGWNEVKQPPQEQPPIVSSPIMPAEASEVPEEEEQKGKRARKTK